MVRLRPIHYVLLMLCAVLSLGAILDRHICALILTGAWNRAQEYVVSEPGCRVVSGLCENSEGQIVQYGSRAEFELDYHTCRQSDTVFRCEVLDTRSPCRIFVYFSGDRPGNYCTGVVCAYGVMVNDCRTLDENGRPL